MRTLNRKSDAKKPAPDPLITQQKHDELQAELKKLIEVKRPRAAEEAARHAEMGDFSENVEYQLAKRRLRGINYAILRIENQLRHAQIIKTTNTETVQIGTTVTAEINGTKKTYTILGSTQTDPKKGIISHTSPIGLALLGKQIGQTYTETINGTEKEITIIDIGVAL